jgi:hypothetical protein
MDDLVLLGDVAAADAKPPEQVSIFLSHHFEYDQFTAPLMLGRTAPAAM